MERTFAEREKRISAINVFVLLWDVGTVAFSAVMVSRFQMSFKWYALAVAFSIVVRWILALECFVPFARIDMPAKAWRAGIDRRRKALERFRSDCKKNRYKESAWRRRLDEWRCRRMEKQYKMEEWRYHEHKIVQHPFCAAFRYCWGFLMLPFVCTAVSFLLLHSDFGALGDNSAVIFLSHFFPVFFPLVDTVSRCLGYIHSCDSARDVVIEYGTVLFWRNSFIFRTASHLVAVAPISQVLFP